jgi:hypothetical protein
LKIIIIIIREEKDLPQGKTPLKLGNCAVLVELALVVELVVPVVAVAVEVEVDWSVIVVLRLITSEDVEEGSILEEALCDSAIEIKKGGTREWVGVKSSIVLV